MFYLKRNKNKQTVLELLHTESGTCVHNFFMFDDFIFYEHDVDWCNDFIPEKDNFIGNYIYSS